MKGHVGNLEVVDSANLLVPNGETVAVSFAVWGITVNARIEFEVTDDKEKRSELRVHANSNDDGVLITFSNWDNSLGIATKAPVEIARLNENQVLYLMAANYCIGDTNKLDINFLVSS